jgi:hypothetical protein
MLIAAMLIALGSVLARMTGGIPVVGKSLCPMHIPALIGGLTLGWLWGGAVGLLAPLLGHLLGISPMVLWHGTCAAPTSVTTVVTEERREGIASFRTLSFGDISHLYVKNEPPAFSARFCECFGNDEVHDYK